MRSDDRAGGERDLDAPLVRALVDSAPDGILLADEEGSIVFANRQLAVQFGYEPDELIGGSVEDLVPDQLREVHRAHRNRYRGEPRLRAMGAGLSLFGRRRDGTEFPVEISLSPLSTADGLRVVAVLRDVTDRVQTEERLRRAEQHLHVVEERERIARDLHDLVIQKLFAAGMEVQSVAARSSSSEHAQRLNHVVDDLDDTIREIRSVIFGLQADSRDRPGLRADVLRVVDEEQSALAFSPRVRFDGPVDATGASVAAEVLPVLREALSNVARHARASSVDVHLGRADDVVTLRVSDDGRGLPASLDGGHGLENMSSRAAKLGGRCRVATRPEGGTELEWQVPDPA
jgi:PAS domain S-box-containing protein